MQCPGYRDEEAGTLLCLSGGDVSLAACVGAGLGNTDTGSGVLLICGDQLTPGPAATLTTPFYSVQIQ